MSKILHLLYISPNGYMGGAEKFVYNAAKYHLNNPKIKVIVLFFNRGMAVSQCEQAGIKTQLLPFSFKMRYPHQVLKTIFYLRRFLKKNDINLIHSTMPYAHIIASCATFCCLKKVKLIWFQHGPVGGLLDHLANFLPVDSIIFNSKYLQREHLKMPFAHWRIKKHKIIMLGIADENVGPHEVESLKERYKFQGNLLEKIFFLSAGRICSSKNYHIIIEALYLLIKEKKILAKDIQYLIVGDCNRDVDKDYASELTDRIKQYQLEKVIHLQGAVNAPQNYYTAADVFLHAPKIPEAFGLAVAEAMKYNCFVIGPCRGGITDILIHEKTGFSFDASLEDAPLKLAALILKVITLYRDEDQRPSLLKIINEGKNLINNNFNEKQMMQGLEKIYFTLS